MVTEKSLLETWAEECAKPQNQGKTIWFYFNGVKYQSESLGKTHGKPTKYYYQSDDCGYPSNYNSKELDDYGGMIKHFEDH